MSHFLAEYGSAAEAFTDGLVVVDPDVEWLFNSDSTYAVPSMTDPLDTRVVHFAMIDGLLVEVVSLSDTRGGVDALFRELLVARFGRTGDERDTAKLDSYYRSRDLCPGEIATAHELLDAVVVDQRDEECDVICAECVNEMTR